METVRDCLLEFLGPGVKPKHLYSDNAGEFKAAVKALGWAGLHDLSTPNRSETNGVVERANRTNQNGISVALVQSGLSPVWWPEAARCFAFMH